MQPHPQSKPYFPKHQNFYTNKSFKKDSIDLAYNRVKNKIFKKISEIYTSKINFNYNGSLVKASPLDFIRVLSEIKCDTSVEHSVRNLVLNSAISCERNCAGSSILFCDMLFSSKHKVKQKKFRVEQKDLEEFIDLNLRKGCAGLTIKKIINHAGVGSTIQFGKSHDQNIHVIPYSGKILSGQIDPLFTSKINSISNCPILLIDGVVETLGEIDSFINKIVEEKTPCVLFARGFGADVSNTLSENFKSKKLSIIPFVYNVKNSEDIVELSIKNKFKCISPETDTSISLIKVEDLSFHDKISFSRSGALISCHKTDSYHVDIKIPASKVNIDGMIKDRMISGKLAVENFLRSGCCRYSLNSVKSDVIASNLSIEIAEKASKSVINLIKDTGLILINS
jgi:hypothetical protein